MFSNFLRVSKTVNKLNLLILSLEVIIFYYSRDMFFKIYANIILVIVSSQFGIVEVEKIMESNPRRIGGLNLTFNYPDNFKATDKEQMILEKAALTCPVFHSIHPDIKVNVAFNFKKEAVSQ